MSKNEKLLEEGDIILIEAGHSVNTLVPEHFVYSNHKGSFKMTNSVVTVAGELSYLEGKYIVVKTTFDGGGTGHGPHDVYPDGHHVHCISADGSKRKLDFYQTGSFTHRNADITAIGKAELKWSVSE